MSCKHKQKLYRQMVQGFVTDRIYKNYKNTLTNIIKRAKINDFTNFVHQHKKNNKTLSINQSIILLCKKKQDAQYI